MIVSYSYFKITKNKQRKRILLRILAEMLVNGLITTHETIFFCVQHIYTEDLALFRKRGFFLFFSSFFFFSYFLLLSGKQPIVDSNFYNLSLMASLVRFIRHHLLGFSHDPPPALWKKESEKTLEGS